MRWYERYPERLRFELAEFERRGLDFALDDERLARTGLVVLEGTLEHEGETLALQVAYPDSFPFLRPEVYAPELRLERHQSPHERNLCLLERSTRAWSPGDTGAWLVAERVPHLLALLSAGGEQLRTGEAPQGEPASTYVGCEIGAIVFVGEEMLALPADERVGLMQLATGVNEPPGRLLRAGLAKVSVRGHGGKRQLAEAGVPLSERFSGHTLDGRWARLERLPDIRRPRDLLEAIVTVEPALARPRWQRLPDGGEISLLGAVFPEEVGQDAWEDGWLFLVSLRVAGKGQESRYIARGERFSAADIRVRLPRHTRLHDHAVGIVGLGSLGGPLALELLRAQVGELRLLDFDRVETGNIVRWTHGLSAVGYGKTDVILSWAKAEYPFTEVKAYSHRIGGIPLPGEEPPSPSETEGLELFLDGLDLVIDATGELGIQQLLSTLADERNLAQVHAWGTEGGWGGAVASVQPRCRGCWVCLQLAFADGSIALPPGATESPVQPRGCADPTFAAASYALTPIIGQTARAAARLLAGEGGGEVHVCALQEEAGELPAPRWLTSAIPVHGRCPCAHAVAVE